MEEDMIREWADEWYAKAGVSEGKRSIRQHLDSELFERLRQKFVTVTGFNGNFVDLQGDSVTPLINERAPTFCQMVQSVPEGKRRCLESDRRVTESAIAADKAVVCRCHAGLYDSATPIRFQRSGIGAFITGQVLLESPDEAAVSAIVKRVMDLGLDPEKLAQAIKEVPLISKEKLIAATEFMLLLADYIEKSLEEAESRRKEAEWHSLLRETEMKVIQSKLHPHFLFNILNLISGQALLENAIHTYATVNQLSKMLRYMVKSFKPLVPLEEELENLDSYVQLQQLRFEDRLKVLIESPDDAIKQIKIPSLTLQIIIENAIKHGIEPKEGKCNIGVRIRGDSKLLEIEIKDDGVGMSAERLGTLREVGNHFNGQLSGIGMIRKRFEFYYGDRFELRIDSELGRGSTVYLAIPN